ncbi:FKBP-type peptidyl-prolyl cis-trans isomerase [Actinoplanes sp. NEAU-A12]|uniref:Peptidyl-prolyl cis-trans isomerase n=1 Tax=Actinoplanes sandaracinus TaxID=3045177 RepID=A0ABT6WRA5_9ACTN|nr:FKBP-type peptidyl-prolyl cis-trans isomerase [Actinoplanes sandaracinus]MDI6102264.1 FKBP-type peptidyl-prolyl cis-trans isomerase [Actinoplanes sandaracinus]
MSDQTTSTSKRRGQAIAGVLSGALVFAVLVGVFFMVRDDDQPVPTAAPASQAAQAASGDAGITQEPKVTTGTGTLTDLVIKELIPGSGEVVKAGQTISVNYMLTGYTSGEVMDSSWKDGKSTPISFEIGTGQLIQGWDKGIPGQKVGSRIQLDVPAALAYGPERGDLRFIVDILSAE